ncbi:MAG: AI-2E family transporter [Planctomycetota bacterium]
MGAEGAGRLWTPTRKAWLVVLGTCAVGIWLVSTLQDVFLPLFLAWALAYLLDPVVRMLEARGLSRGLAVGLVFLVFLVLAAAMMWWLVVQAVDLWGAAFGTAERPEGFMTEVPRRLGPYLDQHAPELGKQLDAMLGGDAVRWQELMLGARTVLAKVFAGLSGVATLLGFFVLVPIYLFYILLDMSKLVEAGKRWIPASQKHRVLDAAARIDAGLHAFLRGRLLIAVLKGLVLWVGLVLCGVPYPFAIGMGSGFLSVVPFIGALIGFVVALVLALLEPTWGPTIGVVVLFGAAETLENYVLFPKVLGQSLDLGEIATMFSLVFWGALFGFFGVLLAVPLTIVLREVARAWLVPSFDRLSVGQEEASG